MMFSLFWSVIQSANSLVAVRIFWRIAGVESAIIGSTLSSFVQETRLNWPEENMLTKRLILRINPSDMLGMWKTTAKELSSSFFIFVANWLISNSNLTSDRWENILKILTCLIWWLRWHSSSFGANGETFSIASIIFWIASSFWLAPRRIETVSSDKVLRKAKVNCAANLSKSLILWYIVWGIRWRYLTSPSR